jgi:hypothetical protein
MRPASGVTGTFSLQSLAPAHYFCGPAESTVGMMVGPNIGYSNALYDAEGFVDFETHGSLLASTGAVCLDKVTCA